MNEAEQKKSKAYDPKEIEEKIYRKWERSKAFTPDAKKKRGQKSFAIVIPPPNITGSLHMGHALNASMQDALIRFHRMKGDDTVWIPGTDHAGIATQNVVEKQLRAEGKTRHDLGREKFIERVWQWKEQSGNTILNQLRRLGASCDWTRLRFTMDSDYVRAVEEAFIHYAHKGLIYRGDRIVNWCSRCATSISDLEVKYEEREGNLYYISYPFSDGSGSIEVATTRPETMLGDTAVAVNSSDGRYKNLLGKKVKLPLTNREIPIIADYSVERDFGTGAVKVTPAHDQADWEIGERHELGVINIIGEDGKMTANAGEKYKGLSTEEAREKVITDLKAEGFMEKDPEKMKHNVALCDRCGTVIQPLISKQWFVKMKDLAEAAAKVEEQKKIKFHPDRWENISLEWLKNVKDWCISRQLWWGHRIPVWFCQRDENHWVASLVAPKACQLCGCKEFKQSEDVLDTWFSSALWPFAVFGWPSVTDDLKRYYPTSVLATARDIINLWVARMIFSGLEFMDPKKFLPAKQYGKKQSEFIPFNDVIIHPTVLNLKGQRMSKSLGTGVDPMDLINQYGTDATRFGLLVQTQKDQQALKFDENAVRTGRNFVNKLWNIGKFINGLKKSKDKNPTAFDKWMLSRLSEVGEQVTFDLEEYNFGDAIRTIHSFVWDEFADWYVEVSKTEGMVNPVIAQKIFADILVLVHPFMPFISEELWSSFSKEPLITSKWLKLSKSEKIPSEVNQFVDIVKDLRSLRALLGIANDSEIEATIEAKDKVTQYLEGVKKLAKYSQISFGSPKVGFISIAGEKGTLVSFKMEDLSKLSLNERVLVVQKEVANTENEVSKIGDRLKQMGIKAPEEVVKSQKELLSQKTVDLEKKKQSLNELMFIIQKTQK